MDILDDFRRTVVDSPDRTADPALLDVFVKSFGMKIQFLEFMMFADGTFHDSAPFFKLENDAYCVNRLCFKSIGGKTFNATRMFKKMSLKQYVTLGWRFAQ